MKYLEMDENGRIACFWRCVDNLHKETGIPIRIASIGGNKISLVQLWPDSDNRYKAKSIDHNSKNALADLVHFVLDAREGVDGMCKPIGKDPGHGRS